MTSGRIPLKQWCYEEAQRAGVTPNAIYMRIYHGAYPGLVFERKNARVVWVVQDKKELASSGG